MGLEMSQPGLDHSALVEEVKETTALAILALGSMMHISEEQARISLGCMSEQRCSLLDGPLAGHLSESPRRLRMVMLVFWNGF